MLQSVKDLRGYSISATDGEIGKVDEFYFDDYRWVIRYMVVQTGNWLFGRSVLISPAFAGPADANARNIPVSITKEQVKTSPDIDTHKPVSRQRDSQLVPYYGWPAYGMAAEALYPPPLIPDVASAPPLKQDPNLRSTKEVSGYQVNATDGEVGRIEDFVFDEATWEIQFIVVDTGKWLNREMVLIGPQWIAGISWAERTVRVSLDSEGIRNSPEFHPVFPISPEYALPFYKHYHRDSARELIATEGAVDAPRVRLSRSETKALYDKISRVYDILSERSEEPVRQAALDRLEAQPGETILEIGFGTGHCALALAKAVGPSGRIHGIDVSEGMLAEAKTLVERAGVAGRVELLRGDAIALPYGDEVMDAVFMSFTLELFDYSEIPLVLKECRRVLKSGGRLVVGGMSKEGGQGLIYEAYEWTHRHFPNFVDCRPISVRGVVEAAGFKIQASSVMQIWVPVEVVLAVK